MINKMEGSKHGSKRNTYDLLSNLNLPSYKYRLSREGMDIFIPSLDIFIFLNKEESLIFQSLIMNKKTIEDTIKSLEKESITLDKIKSFLNEIKKFSR